MDDVFLKVSCRFYYPFFKGISFQRFFCFSVPNSSLVLWLWCLLQWLENPNVLLGLHPQQCSAGFFLGNAFGRRCRFFAFKKGGPLIPNFQPLLCVKISIIKRNPLKIPKLFRHLRPTPIWFNVPGWTALGIKVVKTVPHWNLEKWIMTLKRKDIKRPGFVSWLV